MLLFLCACLSSCTGQDAFSLSVTLRTDFQAIREFTAAEVRVEDRQHYSVARVDGAYVRPGEELVLFDNLFPSSERRVTITLLRLGGGTLASSFVVIDQRKDIDLTIAVTRDCAGVTCDSLNGLAQRCLQGQCVDARCAEGDESFCTTLSSRCERDEECSTSSVCASPRCEKGICYEDALAANVCAVDDVCDLGQGCVPAPDEEPCTAEADCALNGPANPCIETICAVESGLCVYRLRDNGTMCGSGQTCAQGVCVNEDACGNGTKDGEETDVDCGGSVCPGCALGGACLSTNDCDNGTCDTVESGTCEPFNTCGNGLLEGSEACDDHNRTPLDGCTSSCLREEGVVCTTSAQCSSGYCPDGVCRPSNCVNGVMDADETDLNCGGSCLPCADGSMCLAPADCESLDCNAGTCQTAPSCSDGLQNGTELGVDCGGTCPLTCVSYDCSTQAQIPLAECEALKDLYEGAQGSGSTIVGWFADAMPCGWDGLTCDMVPGNITAIDLRSKQLKGVLPAGLGVLNSLTSLQMDSNPLTGVLPSDIGTLSNLTTLHIQGTNISGAIPASYGMLASIDQFWFEANQLSGPLPKELGQLPGSSFLLANNAFTGAIPPEFGQLTSVTVLDLRSNQLTGAIPSQLGLMSSATQLSFDDNMLTGPIPPELGQLMNVFILDLSMNQLTGGVPGQLGQMTALQALILESNALDGAVEMGVTNLGSLTVVRLCPQMGALTTDAATGTWLRGISMTDWPAGNVC